MRSTNTINPVRKHRREVLLRIVLPVALPALGLVVLAVVLAASVAADALVSTQITNIMGILFTLFVAIPLVLLCLLPYVLAAFLAVGAGRLYAQARSPIRFVRRLTEQAASTTNRHAPRLAQPLIGLNARLTKWEYRLKGLQAPVLPPGKDLTHD